MPESAKTRLGFKLSRDILQISRSSLDAVERIFSIKHFLKILFILLILSLLVHSNTIFNLNV